MRYLLIGLFAGIIVALLPVWMHVSGIEIYPEWSGKINSIGEIEQSRNLSIAKITLPSVRDTNSVLLLTGSGRLLNEVHLADSLLYAGGNGRYYVQYEKVGKWIEFYSIQGDRFWKIKSLEYPFLSYNGKIILLMNGDHSRVRIVDYNGNELGAKAVHGRFCTSISFSAFSDFACIGFLDGSYFVIDESGALISSGILKDNAPIKGTCISKSGNYFVIHYGTERGDFLDIFNVRENDSHTIKLNSIHLTKTAMHIADTGFVSILDTDRILIIESDGDIYSSIKIPPGRYGHSRIDCENGMYIASYTQKKGDAIFMIFRADGKVLYSREFPEESFLDCSIKKSVILLRGNHNLYCYSFY